MDDSVGPTRNKAPSRQQHACAVCGKVYSRAEYVRRHVLTKHATKLDCPEPGCSTSFTRQDLLLRHLKIYHPARETPSPTELSERLDLPAPLPIREDSMNSVSSMNSQASSSSSFFGGPIASSPELMAHPAFSAELPIPPFQGTAPRRTATYPLPLQTAAQPMPYTPYPIPQYSVPSSVAPSPSSSTFLPHPFAPSASSSLRGGSGRSYTLPALVPTYAQSHDLGRATMVDSSTQTDLLASHIPHITPPPFPPSQPGMAVDDRPLATPNEATLAAFLSGFHPEPSPFALDDLNPFSYGAQGVPPGSST